MKAPVALEWLQSCQYLTLLSSVWRSHEWWQCKYLQNRYTEGAWYKWKKLVCVHHGALSPVAPSSWLWNCLYKCPTIEVKALAVQLGIYWNVWSCLMPRICFMWQYILKFKFCLGYLPHFLKIIITAFIYSGCGE